MIVEFELIKPVRWTIAVNISDDQFKAILLKALETLGASISMDKRGE